MIECGKTWERLAGAGPVDNLPREEETFRGIERIARVILDPVTDRFGKPTLTYGFASPRLTRHIHERIAPVLDQHAGSERKASGALVCSRGGQAVDLFVPGLGADELVGMIIRDTPFDRVYFFGKDRPIHVSACQSPVGQIVLMVPRVLRVVPRVVTLAGLPEALRAFPVATRIPEE